MSSFFGRLKGNAVRLSVTCSLEEHELTVVSGVESLWHRSRQRTYQEGPECAAADAVGEAAAGRWSAADRWQRQVLWL
jgi:hypothetical protein